MGWKGWLSFVYAGGYVLCGGWWVVDHPTTAQAKDATSASKKNYLSSTHLNYHHSINVMNTCPHATTETNNYCVIIGQSIEISCHAFMQVCKLYKWWLWIFFTIKSPDEWVITKQACRDESIVSLFFPHHYIYIYIYIYHYMLYCSIHFISPLLPLYPIFYSLPINLVLINPHL